MKTAAHELISGKETLLPPHHVETAEGALTLSRAWPVPDDGRTPGNLAVELSGSAGIRAGWWRPGAFHLLTHGEDPKLRVLSRLVADRQPDRSATVVSHRPGKRAVVSIAGSPSASFVKVVKRGKAAGILDGIHRAQPFNGPFRLPHVTEHTDSTVTFGALAGVSLHDPSSLELGQWERAWTQVGQAWAESVTSSLAPETSVVHRADAEVGVLRHWFQQTQQYLHDPDLTGRTVERLSAKLLALAEDRLVPAHRDLHDKQLMWSPQLGPGLLDVDTACLANPALDLGNLRAHASLRQLQGVWSPDQAETVRFCVDETAEACAVPRHESALYEQAAQLRLGLVYSERPQYAEEAAHMRQWC